MLTQDQLKQLEPLTKHPRFGQLLLDAIEIWKKDDVTPGCNKSGLDWFSNPNWKKHKVWKLTDKKCPCLIGASLVNKEITKDTPSEEIAKLYNLSNKEIFSLQEAFDNLSYGLNNRDKEANIFASKVRKIVNPVNYNIK